MQGHLRLDGLHLRSQPACLEAQTGLRYEALKRHYGQYLWTEGDDQLKKLEHHSLAPQLAPRLMMFLLRAHRPEKFRDKYKVDLPAVDAAIGHLLRKRGGIEPTSGTPIAAPAPAYEYSSAAESHSDSRRLFPDHSDDDKGGGRFKREAW
jgi:hypothetical protein